MGSSARSPRRATYSGRPTSPSSDLPSSSEGDRERGPERGAAPTLRGRVVSGKREAASFTEVPWVREGLRNLLGADPYPGTLNLRPAEPSSLAVWHEVRSRLGVPLEPQDSGYCAARVFPVVLESGAAGGEAAAKAAAIILPLVPGYPEDLMELVAGEGLRESLAVRDGDEVTLTIVTPSE
jgi:CTP-dependent riboflavin kinase